MTRRPVRREGPPAVGWPAAGPQAAWTFIEAIVVIAIVTLLTGTVAFSAGRYIDRARVATARAEIAGIRLALYAYSLDTGAYPTEGQGLAALWEPPTMHPIPDRWAGPYLDTPAGPDPWGHAYRYIASDRGATPFIVVSYGSDGLPGGVGNASDIGFPDR